MWYQLKAEYLPGDALESISEQLEASGALSVTYMESQHDEPIYEPELNTTPLWSSPELIALFDDEQLMQQALQMLKKHYGDSQLSSEQFEDKAWEREWLNDFRPIHFSGALWVCPTHCTPPQPEHVNILLDPGLAFGTGTHQTTALCMRFLGEYDLVGKRVCDYGTGSGILAIAAAKLGAKHVTAVDIDPQAVLATHSNATLNQVNSDLLTVGLVEETEISKVDFIMANILAEPLVALAPTLVSYLNRKGELILSGILEHQLEMILNAYLPYFQCHEVVKQDEWQRVYLSELNIPA